jgi:hypothetical protein
VDDACSQAGGWGEGPERDEVSGAGICESLFRDGESMRGSGMLGRRRWRKESRISYQLRCWDLGCWRPPMRPSMAERLLRIHRTSSRF